MKETSDPVLISVIVPVYGVEKYIERCARSLFEQTMQEGIEYLFVDDCSPDRSIEILEKVLAEYPHRERQTTILRLTENQGSAKARDMGMAIAKGEYIAYCDSDDRVDRDAYRMIIEKALAEDLDMVVFNYKTQSGPNQEYSRRIKNIVSINTDNVFEFLLSAQIAESLCNKTIKRDIYKKIQLFPASNIGEDFVITTQLCYYCNKIGYMNNVLYYYYYNNESQSHKPTESLAIKRSGDYRKNIDIVIEFLKEKGLYEKYKHRLSFFKLRCRNLLLPYMNERNYRLWRATYPELDRWAYFSHLPKKELFKYLLVRSRMYRLFPTLRALYWRIKYSHRKHI